MVSRGAAWTTGAGLRGFVRVTAVLTAAPGVGQTTTTVTLVGAVDIASCSSDRDKATANVLANVSGTVFTLGDNVYPDGTAAQFQNCYDPTWGVQKTRTKPSADNHDYQTPYAPGYFGYSGAKAGDPSEGYYTYSRGNWRILVLNSNCSEGAAAANSLLKVAGSSRPSPTTRPGAPWPTTTTRFSPLPGPLRPM
jgi:hypothetical protein